MDKKMNAMRFCQGRLAQQSLIRELSKIGTVGDCSRYSNEDIANILRKTFHHHKSND